MLSVTSGKEGCPIGAGHKMGGVCQPHLRLGVANVELGMRHKNQHNDHTYVGVGFIMRTRTTTIYGSTKCH